MTMVSRDHRNRARMRVVTDVQARLKAFTVRGCRFRPDLSRSVTAMSKQLRCTRHISMPRPVPPEEQTNALIGRIEALGAVRSSPIARGGGVLLATNRFGTEGDESSLLCRLPA